MEIILAVFSGEYGPDTFQVYCRIQQPVWIANSVYNTDEFVKWR